MKKFLAIGMGIFALGSMLTVALVSCTRSLSLPVTTTVNTNTPTHTPIPVGPTSTFTNTTTNTVTPTPPVGGFPTSTFTNTPTSTSTNTPTSTPGGAVPTVIYDNGAQAPTNSCGYCSWSGGGDAAPIANPSDSTPATYPNGETQALSFTFGTLGAGGWAGDTWISGYTVAAGPVTTWPNFEGFTTCTFYAEANETGTAGFQVIVPQATGSPAGNIVSEALTTSWTHFTFTITDGSRTDGYGNSAPPGTSLAQVGSWLIIDAPNVETTPFIVYVDDMTCQ